MHQNILFSVSNEQLGDDIYVDTKQNNVPADIWEQRFYSNFQVIEPQAKLD